MLLLVDLVHGTPGPKLTHGLNWNDREQGLNSVYRTTTSLITLSV
jgi:hypothetical protein